jgi:DNA-directed RNA polymerase I, II, and III subunit RPABC2
MADEYEEAYDDVDDGVALDEDVIAEDGDIAEVVAEAGPKQSSETQELLRHHPEIWVDYTDAIIQKLDRKDRVCYPFLTQFEKTKVLSFRASQLAQGGKPYIAIPDEVTDVYSIAKMELKARRLPFIVKRPLPDGDYEYWRLSELLIFD